MPSRLRPAYRVAQLGDEEDPRESNARAARRLDDRGIGLGACKLLIAGVQVSNPARQPTSRISAAATRSSIVDLESAVSIDISSWRVAAGFV
jgi:hypothetical protein